MSSSSSSPSHAAGGALVEGLAGAGGAIVALLTTYPLLTINTRQQTAKAGAARSNASTPVASPSPSPVQARRAKTTNQGARGGNEIEEDVRREEEDLDDGVDEDEKHKSTFSEAAAILKASGILGLYAGLKPALVGAICSNAVYFSLCGYLRELYLSRKSPQRRGGSRLPPSHPSNSLNPYESLVIAALSGCGNVLATNPIWIIVTRMQAKRVRSPVKARRKPPKGQSPMPAGAAASNTVGQAVRQLYADSGVLGFWKGVVPSLVMVSNPSIQYAIFEWLSNKVVAKRKAGASSRLTATEIFAMTSAAKLGATLLTYPLLVVKSTAQNKNSKEEREASSQTIARSASSSSNASSSSSHASCSSSSSTILGIVEEIFTREGFFGFYKGIETKVFQSMFAASVLYVCKEEIKKGVARAYRLASRTSAQA